MNFERYIGLSTIVLVFISYCFFLLDERLNALEYATQLKVPPASITISEMDLRGYVFSEASDAILVAKSDFVPNMELPPQVQQAADFYKTVPTTNFSESVIAMLKKSEGTIRTKSGLHKAYRDTEKKLTIGYGCCIDCGCLKGTGVKLNDSKTIDEATAMYLLRFHINVSIQSVRKNLPWFDRMPNGVKIVLIDMAYNMGIGNLLKFKFLSLLEKGKFYEAGVALETGGKRYISQVKGRALKNIRILKSMEQK